MFKVLLVSFVLLSSSAYCQGKAIASLTDIFHKDCTASVTDSRSAKGGSWDDIWRRVGLPW